MITVKEIKNVIGEEEFEFYGIRLDTIKYEAGEKAYNSHQLFQDPIFDENDELAYPQIEEGPNKGFYDAGELDGTCAIQFDPEDDESIEKALKLVSIYGDENCNIHVLGGYYRELGLDEGEIIMRDAEVVASWKK